MIVLSGRWVSHRLLQGSSSSNDGDNSEDGELAEGGTWRTSLTEHADRKDMAIDDKSFLAAAFQNPDEKTILIINMVLTMTTLGMVAVPLSWRR